ncbi:MAG: response regulator, partial [Labilibaculum sp.]
MTHILVVDDEKSIRLTVSEFLKDAGYIVETAEDADEALEILSTTKMDVVVSDIVLPRITGIDLLKSIRNASPNVQVILMTGEPNVETASEAVRAGAFDYLTKPVTKEKITRIVSHACKVKVVDDERRRLEKENKEYQKNLEKLVEERTKSLSESEERFKSLHNASFGGIAIHDKGIILECNLGLSEMTGYSVEELIGMDGLLLIAEKSRSYVMSNIQSGYEKSYEAFGLRKNGDQYPLRLEARNVHYKGKPVRTVEFRDITERKQIEEALRHNEEMILSSQSVANICSYSTNLDVNEIEKSAWVCSPEFYKIFGIDETYPHTIEGWANFIHPDYRKEVFEYHESVVKERKIFNRDYKIIRINDGAERWVHGTGKLEFDEKGNPARMHGAIQDITERKEAEKILLESEQRYRTLSNSSFEA